MREAMGAMRFVTRRVVMQAGVLAGVLAVGLAACHAAVPHRAPGHSPAAAMTSASVTPSSGPGEAVTAADLGASWRPGCPVEPAQLRRVRVEFLGFDGNTHRGELIVHRDLAPAVIEIFTELLRIGFPIEKMHTVERYPGADDELSMRDDNTSAFNCRAIPGSTRWSEHAFGRAIDINPLLNPCIHAGGLLEPSTASAFLDRTRTDPGLLHRGDAAVRVFLERGWRWGGDWADPIDYQHFELP